MKGQAVRFLRFTVFKSCGILIRILKVWGDSFGDGRRKEKSSRRPSGAGEAALSERGIGRLRGSRGLGAAHNLPQTPALYYGIPQKDVNAIAHQLLDRYGSFGQVFAADYEQLLETPGMTASAALLLKIVPQLSRRYVEAVAESVDVLDSSEKIGKFLIPKFLGRTEEVVYLLCLNNACRLLRCDLLSEGTLNGAQVDVRRLVEIAFQCKAINVVLAHNHPHGLSRPSSQDIRMTQNLAPTLKQLNLELLDHFIVSGNEYVSMMEMGYLGVKRVRDFDF